MEQDRTFLDRCLPEGDHTPSESPSALRQGNRVLLRGGSTATTAEASVQFQCLGIGHYNSGLVEIDNGVFALEKLRLPGAIRLLETRFISVPQSTRPNILPS